LMVSIGVAPVSEKQMSKFEKALKKRKAKREGGRIGFNYGGDDQDYSNPVLGLDERAKEYEEAWRPDVGDRDPQADPFQNLSAEAAQDWEMEHGAQIVSNYRDAQIAGDVAADDDDNNILQAVAPVTELSTYETNYNYFLPLWNSALATNAKLSNAIQGGYENMGRITKRLIKNRTTSIFNKDDNYYILPGLNPNTTEEWGSEDEKRDWIGQSVESGTIAGYSNPEEAEIDREEMFEQLVNREDLDQPRDNKEAEPEPEPNQTKEEHRGGGASGGLFRNYKKEYANYQSQPEQKKNRAGRNAARRSLLKTGRVNKGDGKDVDHRDGNPRNNSPSNLLVKNKSSNRSRKFTGGSASMLSKAAEEYVQSLADSMPEEAKTYRQFYRFAKEAGLKYPEAVAAQASLESGHGKSPLAVNQNNVLGIKVLREAEVASQKAISKPTTEYKNGKKETVDANFRVFNEVRDSFPGYRKKIEHERYDKAKKAKSAEQYLKEMQKAHYGSDPKYAKKTIDIMNRYEKYISPILPNFK